MLERSKFENAIKEQLTVHAACGLLGPRQCGKTTLARKFTTITSKQIHSFDLEDPRDLAIFEQPLLVLEKLTGLVIIDEVQRVPEIFPLLRVLIDQKKDTQYLILGSASQTLLKQSSESLAGRIGYIELTPFQLAEGLHMQTLLMRGGFPKSYLATTQHESSIWREAYIQTFLERDIPNLGFRIAATTMRRFWMMLTHVHGQLLNMNELATALSVSGHTIRHYLDILAGTFMIRMLLPWHENIHKRQIKTPKLYFRDTGLLLSLMGLSTEAELLRHPRLGAIWEGFALEQIILKLDLRAEACFFWRTQGGAELDLFFQKGGQRYGVEFKYTDVPRITQSMHQALKDLNLEKLYVIYPGNRSFILANKIQAIGLESFIAGTDFIG
jgi:predicted AAA+ superfamily ATPase